MPGFLLQIRFEFPSLRCLLQLGQMPHSAHSESIDFGYQSGIPICFAQQSLESTLCGLTNRGGLFLESGHTSCRT